MFRYAVLWLRIATAGFILVLVVQVVQAAVQEQWRRLGTGLAMGIPYCVMLAWLCVTVARKTHLQAAVILLSILVGCSLLGMVLAVAWALVDGWREPGPFLIIWSVVWLAFLGITLGLLIRSTRRATRQAQE
jgi:hypothetical protein